MTHFLMLWFGAFVVFLLGAACGTLVAWRRYTLAIEDRDHQARRAAEKVAGYMTKGVEFNESILDILRLQGATHRAVAVDWALLTQAANGAGFILTKAEPGVAEKLN